MTEADRALRLVDQLLAECRTAVAVSNARRGDLRLSWDDTGGAVEDLRRFADWNGIVLEMLTGVSDKQTAAIETLALVTKALLDRLDGHT